MSKSKSGSNTINGTAGNEHLNGGSGADIINGMGGDDRINGGSGNDVLDGGAGNDRVHGDAGDDLASYVLGENVGSADVYDGGSGIDTLQLVMTRAEWQSPAVQADIARYLAFLADVIHPVNGQANNRNFTFSFGLTVSKFENLSVLVDGVAFDPRDEAVTLVDDVMAAGEETASVSVDVLANDSVPDLIATLTNTQPSHGSVTLIRTSGAPATADTASFVYTPDSAHWQYLAVGETATDTFTYTVTDSDGDTRTATVTVTITGANDAPTISAAVSTGAVVEDAAVAATGTVDFADVDLSDSHTATSTADGAGYIGTFTTTVTDDGAGDGAGSVTWDFVVDNAAIQFLAAGEVLTQTYTVTVDDGQGGTVSQPVTVTITGSNDAPIITAADAAGSVTETSPVNAPFADVTPVLAEAEANDDFATAQVIDRGLLRIAANANLGDPGDASISVTGSVDAPGAQDVFRIDLAAGELLTLDVDFAAGYGTGSFPGYPANFGLDSFVFIYDAAGNLLNFNDDAPVGIGGSGSLASQDSYLQFSPSEGGVYYILVKNWDGGGARSAGPYTLQVSVDSQNLQLTDTGVISFADVDLIDVHSVDVAAHAGDYLGVLTASLSDASTGDGSGSVTWSFSVANAAVRFLGAGETRTQTYTVSVDDGQGGVATQDVTITITGENDGPVISSAFSLGELVEGGAESVSGVITFDDVDLIDAHSVSTEAEGEGYLGTFTAVVNDSATGAGAGEVTWSFSGTPAELAYLAEGQSLLQRYLVTIDDGNGGTTQQLVNITIVGTNDAPTITSAVSSGAVVEDGVTAVSGAIAFADVDLRDGHTVASTANRADYLGTFTATVTDDGAGDGVGSVTWDFSVDNAAIQYLAVGETLTQTYTVVVDDGQGGTVSQLVTVTITGTNDAPTVVSAVSDGSVTETADLSTGENVVTLTATGSIAFADIDVVDTHSATVTAQGSDFLGALTLGGVDQAGNAVGWTFSVNDADIDFLGAGETRTQNYTVAVSDGQGGTVEQVVTITVNGTNDAPTVTSGASQVFSFPSDNNNSTVWDGNSYAFQESGFNFDGFYDYPYNYGGVDNGGMTYTYGSWNWSVGGSDGTISRLDGADFGISSFSARSNSYNNVTATVNGYRDGVLVATQVLNLSTTHQTFTLDPAFGNVDEVRFDAPQNDYIFLDEIVIGSTATTVQLTELADGTADEGSATLSSSGTTTFFDVDLSDTHTATAAAQGSGYVGGLTIDGVDQATNTVNWTFTANDGEIDYLAAGETLTQTYAITVDDGNGGTVVQTVTVTLTGSNDGPVANADMVTTNEDTPVTFDVRANDTDDGSSLNVSHIDGSVITVGGSVNLADGGRVTLNGNGTLTYTPAVNANGAKSFDYTISDGQGGSATSTVDVTVNPVNDRPVAVNDVASATEASGILNGTPGQAATGNVLANDTDIDDSVLVVSAERRGTEGGSGTSGTVGSPLSGAYGTLLLNADGSYSYAVNETNAAVQALNTGGTLTDTFTYTVQDAAGLTDTAELTITINGANDAPVAQDVTLQANQLGNGGFDATPNFSGWTVSTATSGMRSTNSSTATIDRSGSVIAGDGAVAVLQFTGTVPNGFGTGQGPSITSAAFEGQAGDTVRFVYKLSSGGDYAIGTGYIRDAVTGAIVQTIFNYQTPFTGSTGVVTQDVVLTGSGNYTIDFRVGSYDATGGLYVGARLDLGFAGILRNGVGEDESFTFAASNFLAGATDVDGGPLSVVSVGTSANGATITLNADGSVLYDPSGSLDFLSAGQQLVDTFEYTISDGRGGFSTATASINVIGKNDGPVAVADLATTDEDTSVTFDVRSNDTDVDSPSLTVTHINGSAIVAGGSVILADGGLVSMNADGTLSYMPAPNANGSKGFSYTISDGNGGTSTSTVDLTVAPVNDAPVAVGDNASTGEDGSLTLSAAMVTANDSDVDGDVLSILSVDGSASLGSVQLVDGQIVYSPGSAFQSLRAGETGLDRFSYTVTDASGATATATVDVVINGANDAPTAGDDSAFSNASGSVVIDVLANDSDPEGEAITIASVGTASHGTVVINADGTVTYTPNAGYSGSDTFTYAVQDASGAVDTATVSLVVGLSDSDTVGGDVFLQGNFMEIGVSASGSLGTASAAPANYHPQGRANISYVVDTDGWGTGAAPRAGDFTLPGSPVDTIVLAFNGVSYAQDERSGRRDIATTTTDVSTPSLLGAQTVGVAGGAVRLTQTITLDPGATYYTTTITVTNVSGAAVNDVRFLRSFDPDQDQFRYGNFTTNNDVLSNPTAGNDLAVSRALGPNSGVSVNLLSFDEDARASNYGFSNTNAYAPQAFDAPVDLNGQLVDQAITMAFNFGTLAPGETMTKVFYTSLNGSSQANDMLIGGTGADVLDAAAGDDFVIGLSGNDQLTGGTGDDTFVFSVGSGNDVVTDFTAGNGTDDVLELRGFGFSDLAGFRAVSSQVGTDVVIQLNANDSITLRDVQLADLSNDDFAFSPVHSSDWM
jgi:VCBS repeat-containing protein